MPAKKHEPTVETRSEVRALVSFGTPQEDIAKYIGVSHPTLRKHYSEEIKISSIKANAQVGKFLFNLASGNAMKQGASYAECSRAAMFWAKTRMGWRETNVHEHGGIGGGAIKTEDVTKRDAESFTGAMSGLIARSGEGKASGEPDGGDESGA